MMGAQKDGRSGGVREVERPILAKGLAAKISLDRLRQATRIGCTVGYGDDYSRIAPFLGRVQQH